MVGTTVGELGEIAVVDRILKAVGATPGLPVGPGDDAAVLACADGRMVVTTDMLVEGRQFRRDWSEPGDIGHKAAAENLADIAAMGAKPTALVVALALPPETEIAWVDGFLAGLVEEAQRAGAVLAGGDLVRGDAITIGVTAFGDLGGRAPILRSGRSRRCPRRVRCARQRSRRPRGALARISLPAGTGRCASSPTPGLPGGRPSLGCRRARAHGRERRTPAGCGSDGASVRSGHRR